VFDKAAKKVKSTYGKTEDNYHHKHDSKNS